MRKNERESDEVKEKKTTLEKKGREHFSCVLSQQDMKKRRFMRTHISTICPILKGIFAFLMKQHLVKSLRHWQPSLIFVLCFNGVFFHFWIFFFKWKLFNGLPYIRGFQVGAKIDKWSWMSTGSTIDLTYYVENVAQMKNCHKIRKNKQFRGFWFDGALCRFTSSFFAFSYVWLFVVFFFYFFEFFMF